MHEYRIAKELASKTNPYVLLSPDKLVDVILSKVEDFSLIHKQSLNTELSLQEQQDLAYVSNNFCKYKPPYYK